MPFFYKTHNVLNNLFYRRKSQKLRERLQYIQDNRHCVGLFIIKDIKKNCFHIRAKNVIHKETGYLLFRKSLVKNDWIYRCKNYSFRCKKKQGLQWVIASLKPDVVSFVDVYTGKILLDTCEIPYNMIFKNNQKEEPLLKVQVGSTWYTLLLVTKIKWRIIDGTKRLSLIDSDSNEIISQEELGYHHNLSLTIHQFVPNCDILAALVYRVYSPHLFNLF
ncbi:MAG: hypothetical protein LBP87_08435 [Planctomycetaceae bacterium]|jgi:hypothetical protein|nr:hypothetical protein [Planctomycetaceae bacterium]